MPFFTLDARERLQNLLMLRDLCSMYYKFTPWDRHSKSGSQVKQVTNSVCFEIGWGDSAWQDGHSNNSVKGEHTRTGGSHHYCFRLASVKISRTCGFRGEQIVNVFSHHLSELSNISWLCGFSAVEPFAGRPGWFHLKSANNHHNHGI